MKNFIAGLIGKNPPEEISFISFTGDGHDEVKAWKHVKRMLAEWQQKKQSEGEKIKIIKIRHFCAANWMLASCKIEVNYILVNQHSPVYTFPAFEPGIDRKAVPLLQRI